MFTCSKSNFTTRMLAITLGFALTISLSPLLTTAYLQGPAGSTVQALPEVLTNEHILKMLKDGIASEIIVAKINATPTRFDTSPSTIQKLKEAGVRSEERRVG